jgi:hypothetical protein
MADALEEQQAMPDVQSLSFEDRLAPVHSPSPRPQRPLRRGDNYPDTGGCCAKPSSDSPPPSRTWTSALPEVWIVPSSFGWLAVTGSVTTRSFSLPGPRAPARPTSRVLWPRPPADRASPAATSAPHGSSRRWPLPEPTAPIPSS